MLVTDQGQTIRIPVHDIRIAGRNTQGVKLFTTGPTSTSSRPPAWRRPKARRTTRTVGEE